MRQRTSSSAPLSSASRPQQSLLVASLDGIAALLNTRTGAIIWQVDSHREVSALASGEQFFVAFGSRLSLISESGRHRETTEELHRRHDQIQAEPSWIEARRTQDGALLWRFSDWNLIGYLTMQASAEVVLVSSTSIYGDQGLHAFDRSTGRRLWTFEHSTGGNHHTQGIAYVQLHYHVQFGKCFIYRPQAYGGAVILDMLTGKEEEAPDTGDLASPLLQWISSPSGRVVLEHHSRQLKDRTSITSVRMLDPTTGALLQERSLPGPVRALSDTGIAYCLRPTMHYSGITAVHLEDGVILWQEDEVHYGQCAATESALLSANVAAPALGQAAIGYVYARDAQSGEVLWHWHTPDSVRSLLALWGRRTPWLLADGARRIGSTLAAVLTEPPQKRRVSLWREISQGRWRHPYGLHRVQNAMSLVANRDAIFLGTRLGVFALRTSDGKVLWHALPTVDVSYLQPTPSWP